MKDVKNCGTKIVGLMGYPVEHSLSPIMHNAAFRYLKLPLSYHLFSVNPKNLKKAIESVKILGLVGLNITIPHKINVIKFLDEIDKDAQIIGAVNTIFNNDGKLVGYNTDGEGFITSFQKELDCNPKGKSCFIVGAGGAGRAVSVKMLEKGVEKLWIADIVNDRAIELANILKKHFSKSNIEYIGWKKYGLNEIIKEIDILVNATSFGMKKKDMKPVVDITHLRKNSVVYDVIYNRITPLMKEAGKRRIKSANGLGMLIYQGACAFKIWTNRDAPIKVMKDSLKNYI